jgi:hypothetical protein
VIDLVALGCAALVPIWPWAGLAGLATLSALQLPATLAGHLMRDAAPRGDARPRTMDQHQHHDQAGTLLAFAGSLWWGLHEAWKAIEAGAPPWSLVPPMLFGVAAVINAARRSRT